MAFTAKILSHVMAFSPPEYCRLFAQTKAYQGGVTGTPGPSPPPHLATPLAEDKREAREGDDGNERRAQAGTAFSPLSIIHSWFIHFCH